MGVSILFCKKTMSYTDELIDYGVPFWLGGQRNARGKWRWEWTESRIQTRAVKWGWAEGKI